MHSEPQRLVAGGRGPLSSDHDPRDTRHLGGPQDEADVARIAETDEDQDESRTRHQRLEAVGGRLAGQRQDLRSGRPG